MYKVSYYVIDLLEHAFLLVLELVVVLRNVVLSRLEVDLGVLLQKHFLRHRFVTLSHELNILVVIFLFLFRWGGTLCENSVFGVFSVILVQQFHELAFLPLRHLVVHRWFHVAEELLFESLSDPFGPQRCLIVGEGTQPRALISETRPHDFESLALQLVGFELSGELLPSSVADGPDGEDRGQQFLESGFPFVVFHLPPHIFGGEFSEHFHISHVVLRFLCILDDSFVEKNDFQKHKFVNHCDIGECDHTKEQKQIDENPTECPHSH